MDEITQVPSRRIRHRAWPELLAVLASLPLLGTACGGGMHNARTMTKVEKRTLVSRPPPAKVPKVADLTTIGARVRINAHPSKVWRVFAVGFGNVANWAGSSVAESHCSSGGEGKLGATRSCKIASHMPLFGGDTYEEKITGWDESRGYFAVLQTRATGPTSLLINENWVSSDGRGGTVVTQLVHMDVNFPANLMNVASRFKRKLVEGQIGLKHLVETGEKVTPENWKQLLKRYPKTLKDNKV